MNFVIRTIVLFLCSLMSLTSHDLHDVYKRVEFGNVAVLQKHGIGKTKKLRKTGSGFIVDNVRGYIITCAHVLKSNKSSLYDKESGAIQLFDGREANVEISLVYASKDVSILRIIPSAEISLPLPDNYKVSFSNSNDILPGSAVVSIGFPRVYDRTITSGIVSGVLRKINMPYPATYDNLIMTDNVIMGGNSGGALYNSQGKVIGITSMVTDDMTFAFSIPSNTARSIWYQFNINRSAHYPMLGVQVQAPSLKSYKKNGLTTLGTKPPGVLISKVYPGTPAHNLKLKRGDILTKVGNKFVYSASQARGYFGEYVSIELTKITFRRNGKIIEHSVLLENGFYDIRAKDVKVEHYDRQNNWMNDIFKNAEKRKKKEKKLKKRPNIMKDLPTDISKKERALEIERRQARILLGEWSITKRRQMKQKHGRTTLQNLYIDYLFLKSDNL